MRWLHIPFDRDENELRAAFSPAREAAIENLPGERGDEVRCSSVRYQTRSDHSRLAARIRLAVFTNRIQSRELPSNHARIDGMPSSRVLTIRRNSGATPWFHSLFPISISLIPMCS